MAQSAAASKGSYSSGCVLCSVLLVRDVAGDEHDAAAGLLDPARGLAGVILLFGEVGD